MTPEEIALAFADQFLTPHERKEMLPDLIQEAALWASVLNINGLVTLWVHRIFIECALEAYMDGERQYQSLKQGA